MTNTIWRDIPQYSRYMASNDGKIKVIKCGTKFKAGYILKPSVHSVHPYPMYHVIGDDGKRRQVYLHHLIVRAFHGPKPFQGAVTRHLDGNPLNNTPDNLCWGTQKENIRDSIKHGTFTYNLLINNEEPIGRELVEYWRCLVKLGFSKRAIAAMYGLHHTYVGKWTNRIYV